MIRKLGIVAAFLSVFLFPWQLWVSILFALSPFEPFLPLAIGLFADTLYYVPHDTFFPVYTLFGIALTGIALFMRSRLKASSIRDL